MSSVMVHDGVSGRWTWMFWAGLGAWLLGLLWHWWRPPSLWLLDVVVIPLALVVFWAGFVALVVAVVGSWRRRVLVAVLPVVVVLTAAVNPTWRVAPKSWFVTHRPLYDMALATEPGDEYYGSDLPVPLRFLTATGKVSKQGSDVRFFPQWLGIPDDAGGYLYSPQRVPTNVDLYGTSCGDPVDLGGGWWMCGMANSGL